MSYISDSCPLDIIAGYRIRPGIYEQNGAHVVGDGVSFTVHSHRGTSCELLLFHREEVKPYAVIPISEKYRIGNVYSILVYGLDISDLEYAYSIDGPYDPERGLIFDKSKYLLDPYARSVTGQCTWGYKPESGFQYKARVVTDSFDWCRSTQLQLPMEDLIIYELHVRGFTKDPSSGVKCPGTFAGLREKIPYLKELGVNALELMPIFEFDEMRDMRVHDGRTLLDYWGYNPVSFFAPNTSYASAKENNQNGLELKELIRDLHENGFEVYLDVVFNHTAEGNEKGGFFSFKGFDNQIYYMLTPEGYYYNFSGCGNTLNCNHPIVQQMILECLRYWVIHYRVDGFRFDLASILGRSEDGSPMSNPPLLESLAYDPILGKVKLIAEAWDAGGLYQVGSFPSWNRWAEWNGRYRDDMRKFLKGDEGMAAAAVSRITGSPDLYPPDKRGSDASVNFLNCHDGFTLYDMYSYNEKHNEGNGWNNTDGDNQANSWNCGAEGETTDQNVINLRRRMVENACAVLLLSRGTPMFYAGDEFCNTQFGNNNAYCQDNLISWLDWNRLREFQEIHDFFCHMIEFRKCHPAINRTLEPSAAGFPAISIHQTDPWNDRLESYSRVVGVMYAGRKVDGVDDIVYLGMNMYWEDVTVKLPELPEGYRWKLEADTGAYPESIVERELGRGGEITWKARSVVVLTAD